ncbi:unnamed protein product [Miscanthus lutarioriparius]|uniref:Uncharacterized protein n=1 Tax=Miscanthus lutarioriparius TaxID=422564 RepID=A0A811MW93_9POAL|nr:unnamed protein product [Miscanthus lutarioriparius]
MLRRLVGGAATVRSRTPAAFRRLLHNGGGGGGCSSGEPESVAYRMSMLRRPSSVRKKGLTWNSCSLIGRLDAPIYVSELNYVLDQNKPQNDADSTSPPSMPSVTPQMQKENECIGRFRLWQVFFANPYEWWDNRQSKPWPTYPDFKHKDTREKIWLRPDDPPWVRKQLELHDLEVAENGHRGNSRLLKSQNWKAQDFDYSDDVQHCAEA